MSEVIFIHTLFVHLLMTNLATFLQILYYWKTFIQISFQFAKIREALQLTECSDLPNIIKSYFLP